MHTTSHKIRGAFTLIELLVVIAIIGLLAAILFPVFGRARENARRSSCQSNQKQIALGLQQYIQDWDEKFPVIDTSTGVLANPGWGYSTQSYIKSEQIFQCPSETTTKPTGTTLEARAIQTGFSDYYMNWNLGGQNQAVMPSSAVTILLGEGSGVGSSYTGIGGTADYNRRDTDGTGLRRHFDGGNYAFGDGHVKWLRPEQVASGTSGCDGGGNAPDKGKSTFCTY